MRAVLGCVVERVTVKRGVLCVEVRTPEGQKVEVLIGGDETMSSLPEVVIETRDPRELRPGGAR